VVQHFVVTVDGEPNLVAKRLEIAKAAVIQMSLPVRDPIQIVANTSDQKEGEYEDRNQQAAKPG
jgi:hypothetical protein